MTHTELLELIRDELNSHDIFWDTEKELFNYLFPNESYKSYASKWNYWYKKTYNKINLKDRNMIQRVLGFESSVWDADNQTQRYTIRDVVKRLVSPPSETNIDLSALLPKNTAIDTTQEKLLSEVKSCNKAETLTLLEDHPNYFKPTPENQNFLLELLSILYNKGLYDLLGAEVFPALLPHNTAPTHIKLFMAHTYGSLSQPDYLRAASILNSIESELDEEQLELHTGAISNIRRFLLEKESLTYDELIPTLQTLISYYKHTYEHIQTHHYYPATNYLYMLKLYMLTSDNALEVKVEELVQIYKETKPSIDKGSHSNSDETRYYAMISDVEFRLLLGRNHLIEHLSSWLENHEPSPTYVERTLRMMRFFVRTVERFGVGDVSDVLGRFREVMEVLDGYAKHTQK